MSDAFIERRRIRTWDEQGPAPETQRWLLVAKAQFLRYRRSWIFWTLVAAGVLHALTNLVAPFGSMDYGGGIDVDVYLFGYGMPAMWILLAAILLAAAPAIADDIRFDAPLFYFSRPLLVRDYLLGKLAFVAGLLALLVLPAAIILTLVGTATWDASGPTRQQYGFGRFRDEADYQQFLLEWSARNMDSFGDWMFTSAFLLVGSILSILFLASLTLAVSSHTQRGWHASIAMIVILAATGVLGAGVGDLVAEGSAVFAFIPPSWPYAATLLPLEWQYIGHDPSVFEEEYYQNALGTALLAALFMALSTIGLLALTHRRLRRLGGAL